MVAIGVLVAALACPVHMLWQMRRKRVACGVAARRDELSELRSRQQALGDELARRRQGDLPTGGGHRAGGEPG